MENQAIDLFTAPPEPSRRISLGNRLAQSMSKIDLIPKRPAPSITGTRSHRTKRTVSCTIAELLDPSSDKVRSTPFYSFKRNANVHSNGKCISVLGFLASGQSLQVWTWDMNTSSSIVLADDLEEYVKLTEDQRKSFPFFSSTMVGVFDSHLAHAMGCRL